ncbi:MAG: hypothetical protein ACEPOW_14125 [Bacteroidales bacterium]
MMKNLLLLLTILFAFSCSKQKSANSNSELADLKNKLTGLEERISELERRKSVFKHKVNYIKILAPYVNIRSSKSARIQNKIAVASQGSFLRMNAKFGNWYEVTIPIENQNYIGYVYNKKNAIRIEKIPKTSENDYSQLHNIRYLWEEQIIYELARSSVKLVTLNLIGFAEEGRDIYIHNISKLLKKKQINLKPVKELKGSSPAEICKINNTRAVINITKLRKNSTEFLKIFMYDYSGNLKYSCYYPDTPLKI